MLKSFGKCTTYTGNTGRKEGKESLIVVIKGLAPHWINAGATHRPASGRTPHLFKSFNYPFYP